MIKKILCFSVLSLMCMFFSENTFAQSDDTKQMSKLILESFCQEHYSSCFSGRTYIENSLTVYKVEPASLQQIKVYGYHSYKGRFGVKYTSYDYYAYIKYRTDGLVEIKFYKKSAPDLFNPDYYWEDCTKIIRIST